ncbi:hypothetical protein Tco_0200097 [Tanacetum coccineum]
MASSEVGIGILVHDSTQIVTKVTPDKSLTLEESNVLSHSSDHSSDRDLLFFLELTVTETLLSFSSKNEDKVFNLGILILKVVHLLSPGILHRSFGFLKDHEDPCLFSVLQSPGLRSSAYFRILNPDHVTPDVVAFKKVEEISEVERRLLALSVRTPDVSVV